MKQFIALVLLIVLASAFVTAQQSEFYHSLNAYGEDYYPRLPEDLRLPEPVSVGHLEFGNHTNNEILAASLVKGEYYIMLAQIFKHDLAKEGTIVDEAIDSRARALCMPYPGKAKDGCMQFFTQMGLRSYELTQVPNYGTCRHNVLLGIRKINEGRTNASASDITALLQYSVQATALKWCQFKFGEKITVIPPGSADDNSTSSNPQMPSNISLTNDEIGGQVRKTADADATISKSFSALSAAPYAAAAVIVVVMLLMRRKTSEKTQP